MHASLTTIAKKVKNTLRMVRNTDISLSSGLAMESRNATLTSFLLSQNHLTVLIAALGPAIRIRMWSAAHNK